jgi:hypothetical protein
LAAVAFFGGGGGGGDCFLGGGGCCFERAFLAAAAAFLAPGGLASVVLLVGGAGPVIVLVILAAGAGVAGASVADVACVALAAGAGVLAVLDVAVATFGGGAHAGGDGGASPAAAARATAAAARAPPLAAAMQASLSRLASATSCWDIIIIPGSSSSWLLMDLQVTIPITNPVEDVHARHIKVHERIVGQVFLLDQDVKVYRMMQEAIFFCINTLVSNRTRCRKRIAKELTKDPIQCPFSMGCSFQRRNHKMILQNDVRHYRKSKAGCCNNLFAIFHFTGLAKGHYKPGAKIVVMDNGCLAWH